MNGWYKGERKEVTAYCQLVRALVHLSPRESCIAVLRTNRTAVEVRGKKRKGCVRATVGEAIPGGRGKRVYK